MKSIKEFAAEYAQDKYLPVQTSQAVMAGADYVLEQISQTLQGDLNSHSAFKLKVIKQIIEQLKK